MFGSKQEKIEKAVAKKRIPELIKFTQDKDMAIVKAAIEGLGKIKEDDSFNALIPFLSNADAQLRAATAEALGQLGNDHAKAFVLHAISIEKDATAKASMEKSVQMLKNY